MRFVVVLAALVLLPSREAAAAAFLFETLTVPGAAAAGARGINNAGLIAGYSDIDGDHDTALHAHAILWTAGVPAVLDFPTSTGDDRFFDINNAGLAVGSTHSASPLLGYLYDTIAATADTFVYPGSTGTTIRSVNDHGDLAGEWDNAVGARAGFLCIAAGACTSVEIPGALQTSVRGVNNAGQLVGYYFDPLMVAHNCLFVLAGAAWTCNGVDFSAFPDAENSVIFGLNDTGLAVGGYFLTAGGLASAQSFIYDMADGSLLPFSVPGATATLATGINDRGQIVGEYIDARGVTSGFVATPVPEPAALLLLVLGAASALRAREPRRTP